MQNFRRILDLPPERRRAWTLIACAGALLLISITSLGSSIYTGIHTLGIGIHSGALIFVAFDEPPALMHGAHWIWPHWRAIWLPEWGHNPSNAFLTLPLWPIILLFLALGVLALYRTRQLPAHLCTNCHYDRRGIPPSAPCPECGTTPKPTDQLT